MPTDECGQCEISNPNVLVSDSVWVLIKPLLFRIRNTQGPSKRQSDREFIASVAYLTRTGKAWRELPHELGHWHSVYMRFRRWEESRVWAELWREMDDRTKRVFLRIFFGDKHPPTETADSGKVAHRLNRALEMVIW